AAFAIPRGLTFGNSGRNILRNPHRISFDMALFKHFAFTERVGLELRAEAFNVFNHTEWQAIAGDSGSAASAVGASTNTLGNAGIFRPNGVHNARVLQLAMKLVF
ncbi:MAG: hypothetical protein M3O09_09545, partial [Acidobacteriota bacterium]|nr:hypothetical protein [Acidobacteriota bacterium]